MPKIKAPNYFEPFFTPWVLTTSGDVSWVHDMLAATIGIENQIALNRPIDSEMELIRAIGRKDRSAFEQLFHLYHERVYKFSIRMLQDHLLAEEVACDTLYAVWNSAAKFREQSAVSSWILGIAYRRSLKIYNKNAKHIEKREADYQLDDFAEPSPASNPEMYVNNAMEIGQLQTALSTLSSNHRAVLELIGLGYSVSEIASIVDCPEGTVKTRTLHARRLLRLALED